MWPVPITIFDLPYWTTLIFLQSAKRYFVLIIIVKVMGRWWQVIDLGCYRPCIEESFCWTKILNKLRILLWLTRGVCGRPRSIFLNQFNRIFLIFVLMIFNDELFKPILFLFSFLGFRLAKDAITIWILLISIKKTV